MFFLITNGTIIVNSMRSSLKKSQIKLECFNKKKIAIYMDAHHIPSLTQILLTVYQLCIFCQHGRARVFMSLNYTTVSACFALDLVLAAGPSGALVDAVDDEEGRVFWIAGVRVVWVEVEAQDV
jgi:hypothetical protein